MGFDLAKHGLNLKMGFKTKFGLILEKKKTGMKRGEGEKKKKRKRKRRRREERSSSKPRYGTLDFCMELLNLSMDL